MGCPNQRSSSHTHCPGIGRQLFVTQGEGRIKKLPIKIGWSVLLVLSFVPWRQQTFGWICMLPLSSSLI